MRCKILLSLFMALLATQAANAQPGKVLPADFPATLMPEKTIAYAELYKVGLLAKEVGDLFGNSALADVPDSLDRIRSKYAKDLVGKPYRGRRGDEEIGIFGLMLAPEIIAELGRLEGGAIAITGMEKRPIDMPEFLAVVMPGQSNAPGYFMRMMLTMAPTKKLETIEGVSIYSLEFGRKTMKKKEFKDAPPDFKGDKDKDKPSSGKGQSVKAEFSVSTDQGDDDDIGLPVFAMTPKVLLVGSRNNVKEAILRLKGKLKTTSLAQTAAFKEARQIMDGKPGLFTYANPEALFDMLEQIRIPFGPTVKELIPGLHDTINPKAFRAMAQSYTLEKGTLTVKEVVLLDSKEKSAVLDLLPTKAAKADLLHFAPKDAVFAAIIDNTGGEERWRKLVAVMDALTPKNERRKPSAEIKEAERELGIDFGKDVAGQIAGVGYALGDPLTARIMTVEVIRENSSHSHSAPQIPMVVIVQATSDTAAENLLNLMPKVLSGGRRELPLTTRTVAGRELTVIKMGRDQEICYGREGTVLVFGPLAEAVAGSLNSGAKKQGLLANVQAAARVKEMPGRQAMLLLKPAHAFAGFAMVMGGASKKATATWIPLKEGEKFKDGPAKEVEKPKFKEPQVKITYSSLKDEPMMKELGEILTQGEFLGLGIHHTKDELQIDGSVAGLRPLVSKLVDFGIEEAYRQEVRNIRHMEERRKDREKFEKEFKK